MSSPRKIERELVAACYARFPAAQDIWIEPGGRHQKIVVEFADRTIRAPFSGTPRVPDSAVRLTVARLAKSVQS
jgi:hypothetical protein